MTTPFIFDFDGTLINSKNAIYQCFNEITKKLAPDRIEIAKSVIIGPPLHVTAKEILGTEKLHLVNKFIESFIALHDNEVVLYSTPYSNVVETLKKLHQKKIPMAIATNKRREPTLKLIHHFGWEKYFDYIECSDSLSKDTNKTKMIKNILQLNSIFKNGIYVGDTVNDGISANKNNLKFIKAEYGYGKNEDWKNINIFKKISNFSEIIDY